MIGRGDQVRDWAIDVAIATAVGAFLGILGPFGSYLNGPPWQRMVFQGACFWAGIALFGMLIRVLMRWGPRGWAFWATLMAGVAFLDLPLAWFTSRLAAWIWPGLTHLPGPAEWYLQALITSVPVVVAFVFLIRQRARRRRLTAEAGGAPVSREGLLGSRPAQVLCLQMEDHYVRVHTQGGSRLVLATLGQAIDALNRTPGFQVHRSWWVAESAVVRAIADGRNLRLELSNGVRAPVARSAVAMLRAAGWLDDRG